MSEPIPSTSASRLLESLSQKSGVPQVYITRTLAASLISAYSFKKIIRGGDVNQQLILIYLSMN